MPKPATRYDPEPVPFTFHLHNLLQVHLNVFEISLSLSKQVNKADRKVTKSPVI
jgi:hypothetical protein